MPAPPANAHSVVEVHHAAPRDSIPDILLADIEHLALYISPYSGRHTRQLRLVVSLFQGLGDEGLRVATYLISAQLRAVHDVLS